jgi:hypothetical protein
MKAFQHKLSDGVWDEKTRTYIKPSGTVKQGRRPMFQRFRDYEPEQKYGTAHDFQEHTRFGGTQEDY